jgi:uncharacterized protein (DUF433 family)
VTDARSVIGAERNRVSRPLYSYADADYLAHVTRGTSKRWIEGYQYWDKHGERVVQPPITPGTDGHGAISFIDLVEIAAIGRLRSVSFSLKSIRRIVSNCQELLHVSRPLTTLKFKTDGREIFVDQGDVLLEVEKRKGQRAWSDFLEPFLEELDYGPEFARRWWPLGKDKPIIVDPDYGHGFPVIKNSGVRTEIILERFQAGDLNDQIAKDFNISEIEVERALQFEVNRAA